MSYSNIPTTSVETMAAAAAFVNMNKSTFRKAFNKCGRNGEFNGYLLSERDGEICIYAPKPAERTESNFDAEATKAAKFEGKIGKEGAWFVGTRLVAVTDAAAEVVFEGSNKKAAEFIANNSKPKCSAQKLRKALKNGQRCNGFAVAYSTEDVRG